MVIEKNKASTSTTKTLKFYSITLEATAVTIFRGAVLDENTNKLFLKPCIAVTFPFFIALKVNSANSLDDGAFEKSFWLTFATSANSDFVAPGQIAVTFILSFFNNQLFPNIKDSNIVFYIISL